MAHGDSARGRDALAALDFFVHADMFLSPTAELADIVLPVRRRSRPRRCGSGSRSARRPSRSCSCAGRCRRRAARRAPICEIVFALAKRLGLGRALLGRRHRRGVAPPARTERDHPRAAPRAAGRDPGAADHQAPQVRRRGRLRARRPERSSCCPRRSPTTGTPPLPTFTEPRDQPALAAGPRRAATRSSSVRQVGAVLRDPAPAGRRAAQRHTDPQVEIHPDTAAARGIAPATGSRS